MCSLYFSLEEGAIIINAERMRNKKLLYFKVFVQLKTLNCSRRLQLKKVQICMHEYPKRELDWQKKKKKIKKPSKHLEDWGTHARHALQLATKLEGPLWFPC